MTVDFAAVQVGDYVIANDDFPSFGIHKGTAYPIIKVEGRKCWLGEITRSGLLSESSFSGTNPLFSLVCGGDTAEDVSPAPIDDIL